MSNKFNHKAPVETDPRFVSGQWKGFWIQHGRCGDMQLHIEFRAGRLSGVGRDRVGSFSVYGTYDLKSGKATFIKAYFRAHQIDYRGHAEVVGQGIWGVWKLPFPADCGGWHIWPKEFDDGQNTLVHEKDVEHQIQSMIPTEKSDLADVNGSPRTPAL
jgi:hypothetical protein